MALMVDSARRAQIRPVASTREGDEPRSPQRAGTFSFSWPFGWTGALMVLAFLLSTAWSLSLAVIQLVPTWAANYVMGTADLDFGDFWNLSRADDRLALPAAALFVSFALGYGSLVVQTVVQSRRHECRKPQLTRRVEVGTRRLSGSPSPPSAKPVAGLSRSVCGCWHLLFSLEESPLWALPKLALQTLTLFRYLREGFPTSVIFTYSVLLCLNWMIASYCIATNQSGLQSAHTRVFSSFDLFFALLAPLHVLVIAYMNFDFNRAEFATRTEAFPSANFDRTARLFADPTMVSRVRIAFQSLEVSTVWSLLIKTCLNTVTIHRWWRIITRLDRRPHEAPSRSIHTTILRRCVNRVLRAVVAGIGLAILVYSIVAVTSTLRACQPFAQCRVPSFAWNVDPNSFCSCVVFIDRQTVVTTFAEWESPVDTSANLATLAVAGQLKIVQVVNRQLPTLPEELRGCRSLQQLVLIYTKTIVIPDWTREFTQLEYLHIQGDFTRKRLLSLPDDLFHAMPRLLFLHLGTLPTIPFIPKLDGLARLRYLTLAVLHSTNQIPNLDDLVSLEQLSLADMIRVNRLPQFRNLNRLKVFGIMPRSPICCNGFIDGACDLKRHSCRDRTAFGEPRVECTTEQMTNETRDRLRTTLGTLCAADSDVDLKDSQATFASTDLACGGVMFKKCVLSGQTGICFPSRLMPVSCQLNIALQQMRRLQIQRKVGSPCDPLVESWLGCKSW